MSELTERLRRCANEDFSGEPKPLDEAADRIEALEEQLYTLSCTHELAAGVLRAMANDLNRWVTVIDQDFPKDAA